MSKATIISILPFELYETKPHIIPSYYTIKASENEEPTTLVVTDAVRFVYLDEKRGSLTVPIFAEEVAKSIVEDFCRAQVGYATNISPGLFWVDGAIEAKDIKKVFPEKFLRAKLEQRLWFQELVKIADDDWTRHRRHGVITKRQKDAAIALKLTREWMLESEITNNAPCKFCTSTIDSKAVVCPNCQNILDIVAYNKLKGEVELVAPTK